MNNNIADVGIDASDVTYFLKSNPHYFNTDAGREALTTMQVFDPDKGDAISMLEYQVKLLRQEKAQHAHELATLSSIAEGNKSTLDGMQSILTAAIDCDSLFDLITTYEQHWGDAFGIDFVRTLSFDRSHPGLQNRCVRLDDAPAEIHEAMLMNTICSFRGNAEISEYCADFDDDIKSWCLLPLFVERDVIELKFAICFGSPRADGFTNDATGIAFLEFMRAMLESLLGKILARTPM